VDRRVRVRTTAREELLDITDDIQALLGRLGATDGLLHLWSLHTTCALTVNEGADPDVARDLVGALRRLVPREGDYRHAEGNSDAHLKTALLGPGVTLAVQAGHLLLGPWQRVFLAEWDGPRERTVAGTFLPAG
jgi:secondary thiamine-phosphate synthase enzyme